MIKIKIILKILMIIFMFPKKYKLFIENNTLVTLHPFIFC
jgi:hypothetical protein